MKRYQRRKQDWEIRTQSKIQNPKSKIGRGFLFFVLPLLLVALACGGNDDAAGPPRNAAVAGVIANTSLRPWLDSVVATFNAAETETAGGDPAYISITYLEAGDAVGQISDGSSEPALWIPDDQVWVNALAGQGNADYQSDCVSVAESPLVIAMWRPVAEALGWPGLPLGWLDVGSLAADQAAWSYYSGGELGDALRLGHTHPGLSGSGAATLLALVHAAESKTEAVTVEDIQRPIVQASVGAFEGAVSWFSPSTDELGRTMSERGIEYLGAAVMYESTVVAYGNQQIVPVYPLEGTFVANHPACLNSTATGDAAEVARLFRDYLLEPEAQQAAVVNGLRPVNDEVTAGAPLDAAHGVDLAQPAVVFSSPTVESLYAIQDVWQAARKPVNLVMLIDTSGSMRGDKIESARTAAVQFVEQMGEEDYITLIAFSSQPAILVDHEQVGPARDQVIAIISDLPAEGDTALYDAIGDGATAIASTTSSQTTNALVVLSDGEDTFSYRYRFDQSLVDLARANDTTVFTIAYGGEASEEILADLALQANGKFYQGDAASITAIYEEMSAAFGGSAGVGR